MDEAHMLGLGKYLDNHGYRNRYEIMLEHLDRVNGIAGKYGFRCAMWSDMFFRLSFKGVYRVYGNEEIPDDVAKKVPKNIDMVYHDYSNMEKHYYTAMLDKFKKFGNNILFAGGAYAWTGLAPHNQYSINATKAAFEACREQNIKEAFITIWGDSGGSCSPFSVLPALFTAAEYAKGNADEKEIKRKFEDFMNIPFDTFMYADLPNVLDCNHAVDRFNPSNYLFYNDCLLGIFDSTIEKGAGKIYKSHAQKLAQAAEYEDWAFLFKPLHLLCEALYFKADLGICTHEAYQNGNRAAVSDLIETSYKPLVKKVREFYEALADYWDVIFKPHGFDIMDLRLGGLVFRLEHITKKLSEYASGAIDKIEELDEEKLDLYGNGKTMKKQGLMHIPYTTAVTVNVI